MTQPQAGLEMELIAFDALFAPERRRALVGHDSAPSKITQEMSNEAIGVHFGGPQNGGEASGTPSTDQVCHWRELTWPKSKAKRTSCFYVKDN